MHGNEVNQYLQEQRTKNSPKSATGRVQKKGKVPLTKQGALSLQGPGRPRGSVVDGDLGHEDKDVIIWPRGEQQACGGLSVCGYPEA